MRRLVATAFALVAGAGGIAGVAAPVAEDGWLRGKTQITFGCPGPARQGGPSCHPWRTFAHARFRVALDAANGEPIPGSGRLVVSDANGRFSVRLAAGGYTVTPLPQAHTRGGARLKVRVEAGGVRRILVRFQGYPLMV